MTEYLDSKLIDLKANEWVRLAGAGVDVYGKVVSIGKDDRVEIVTSTITGLTGISKDGSFKISKIDAKAVPKKARTKVLARIAHPPAPKPNEIKDPRGLMPPTAQ